MPIPSYSSDQPINARDEDRFKRWSFANRIAETIALREDVSGLVVGIYGTWGDGKTSVLNLIEQELSERHNVAVLHFNPWLFGSGTELIESFFATLADGLGKKLTTVKEDIGGLLKKYGSIFSLARIGDFDKLGEALSETGLSERRDRVEAILNESRQQIVILIDDIDRLERHEIQAMFKLVKIAAGFQKICYVLAFDDDVVSAALGQRYGAGTSDAGRRFLEKIVQVPLPLPPADPDSLRHLAFDGVNATLKSNGIELTESQANTYVRHFTAGCQIRLRTPRLAKLYVNSLAFAIPILKGEVNVVDQMLIEGLRVFYPRLYVLARNNAENVLGPRVEAYGPENWRAESRNALEKGMEELTPEEKHAAWELLEALFPRLKSGYGTDWEDTWEREQRICARYYFGRYFHYGVPPGDVPDFKVQEILKTAARGQPVEPLLKELCDARSASRLVSKLRQVEKAVSADAAETIAYAISLLGESLPFQDGIFGLASTRSQAAILVDQLVRRIPEGEGRDVVVRQIMRTALPLPFAADILRWTKPGKDEAPLVSDEVRKELHSILGARIKACAEPVYRKWPDDAPRLLYLWSMGRSKEEVEAYIRERLTADPKQAEQLILAFCGTAVSMESGIPHKADFEREGYESLQEVIDPDVILAALRRVYGAALDSPKYYEGGGRSLEERAAHQFVYVHQRAQKVPTKHGQTVENRGEGEGPAPANA